MRVMSLTAPHYLAERVPMECLNNKNDIRGTLTTESKDNLEPIMDPYTLEV